MQKYRKRHAIGACCLCFSTVCVETSYIPLDDCFAAFCRSGLAFAAPKEHQYYNTKPPWANAAVSLGSIRVWQAKCGNGSGWTRRIPAAEWRNRGGGRSKAESPADAERGCCGGREKSLRRQRKVLRRQRKLLGRKTPRTGAVSFRGG